MNRNMIATVVLAGCLVGCAGVNHSMQYNDVKHVVFSSPELPHAFWIFDKPLESRMLINTGLGAAMAQGAAKGLTLGIADTSSPHQVFERAANLWFASTNRPCKVSKIERIIAPTNYEAVYSCDALL